MLQMQYPKPFDEPDESGNIFDPRYRSTHISPYERVLTFEETWENGLPTFSTTFMEPKLKKGKLFMHFTKDESPLMNEDIRRILLEHRFSCGYTAKEKQRWFETPVQYLILENDRASPYEIETMLRNHDYPDDVGIYYEYRKIVQRYMDIDMLTDNLGTLAYLIFQTANISRMLYFEENDEKHMVSTLDVLDTMLNALPDIDYLSIYFTNQNMLEFIYRTMTDIGYTGYIMNPECMFGGTFTGKTENIAASYTSSEWKGREVPVDEFARMMDVRIAWDSMHDVAETK